MYPAEKTSCSFACCKLSPAAKTALAVYYHKIQISFPTTVKRLQNTKCVKCLPKYFGSVWHVNINKLRILQILF